MEKIQNQKHSLDSLFYALSRMFERASYYGFRALIVLYMIGETLKMDRTDALSIYGWLTGLLVLSHIIGAILGDLLIGNKNSIIIGGLIHAIGAFTLLVPSTIGLYSGLALIVLGNGFYTPNITANFGKLYLNKTKLLDAGFTVFYLAINLGAFLGILLIGYVGETYGDNIGFMITGMLMLLSLIPIILSKENTVITAKNNQLAIGKRVLSICIAFIVVGLFWGVYELIGNPLFNLQLQFVEISAGKIPQSIWQSMSSYTTLLICLIAIIIWTRYYSSKFFKLMLGFIFGVVSIGILFIIPEIPTEQHIILYVLSIVLLGLSEIFIAPIIYSILTQYTNPKYLAILISLIYLPIRLFSVFIGLFSERLYEQPRLGLTVGIAVMAFTGIGLIAFVLWNRNTSNHTEVVR